MVTGRSTYNNRILIIEGNGEFKMHHTLGVVDNWNGEGVFVVQDLLENSISFCEDLIDSAGKPENISGDIMRVRIRYRWFNVELSSFESLVMVHGVEFEFIRGGQMYLKYGNKTFTSGQIIQVDPNQKFLNAMYRKGVDINGEVRFRDRGNRLILYVNNQEFADLGLRDYKVNSGKFLYVRALRIDTREFENWVVRMYATNFNEAEFNVENKVYCVKMGYLYFLFAERREGRGYELSVIGYEDDKRFELKSCGRYFFIKYVGDGERLDGVAPAVEISRYESIEKDEHKDIIFKGLTF